MVPGSSPGGTTLKIKPYRDVGLFYLKTIYEHHFALLFSKHFNYICLALNRINFELKKTLMSWHVLSYYVETISQKRSQECIWLLS